MRGDDLLARVYRAQDTQELKAAYALWADTYDADLVEGMGWDKPVRVGETLLPWLSAPSRNPAILDVACGTGLVGVFLHQHGFDNLSALDFSSEMLEKARARGVYQSFWEMDLSQPLSLPDQSYDAITAVGIFTEGHAGPDCLPELCRVLKPAGLLALSLRQDLQSRYQTALQSLPWKLCTEREFSDGLDSRPWSARVYRKEAS